MRTKYIHPFPARMAPEIAMNSMKDLHPGDKVLDPMVGSGTVLHHAAINGFEPIGFDLDPLAISLTKSITSTIDIPKLEKISQQIVSFAERTKLNEINLPWIDNDEETKKFIKFWFGISQKNKLRKLAFAIKNYKQVYGETPEINIISIALSKIIITKKVGASLAWDISHSRPHKTKITNDYNVILGFKNSLGTVIKYLKSQKDIIITGNVTLGDARSLSEIKSNSIDRVITSPPYLNAIDYMRGNKFSLVWLGFSISELRKIRSITVGVERKQDAGLLSIEKVDKIYKSVLKNEIIGEKQKSMIKRYIEDSIMLMAEISRVLKVGKKATLVIGNSTLNGVYIKNSQFFNEAGKISNLLLKSTWKREIPLNSRYLPMPNTMENSLGKRMKHEMVLTFIKTD